MCLSTDEEIKTICYIHTMELYSGIKNEIMSLYGKWMKLEHIMLSKISQAQKVKGQMFLSHMWKLERIKES